jgi:type I restriction enzyme S subunit
MSEKTINKVPNVPNLRFNNECWMLTSLGFSCDGFDYGIAAEAKEFDGINQYIRITDIDDDSSSYTSRNSVSPSFLDENCVCIENDILFARTGASTGKTYLYNRNDGKLYFAGFLIRANVKPIFDPYFVFTMTKTSRYANWIKIMSARSGQPGINAQEYKTFSFYHPSLKTQNKISKFIKNIDKRIQTQSKIIEDYSSLKKSIIDNFFNELTNSSLGEHIIEITERNGYKNEYEVLSVSNKYGFIKQNEQFEDRIIASENKSNYKVVRKNTFAYNPTRINVGSIACMHYLDIGIVSPMYLCFSTLKTLSPYYLEYYFLSKSFKLEMNKKLEGSVRMCLQIDALKKIKLYIPSLEIQNKFVNKLSCFDKKIQKEKDILSLYKKQKAYLLQNMFI